MNSGGGSMPQINAGQLASDQTKSNVGTAVSNAWLNNTNQITPYGSLTYEQTGTHNVNGQDIPQFTARQTLSPEQQAIYNKTTGLQTRGLDTAGNVLTNVDKAVGTPLSYEGLTQLPQDQTQLRNTAYDALMSRSRTDLGRAANAQDTQLANQGIAQGSEAWKRAQEGQGRALTDASQQAEIGAGNVAAQNLQQAQTLRNQGINERTSLRNSPLQDYQALLGVSGGVTPSNFVNTPQSQIANTDTYSPALAQYGGQMQQWQTGQNANNALTGALFGLGGSVLGGLSSGYGFGMGRKG